MLIKVSYTIDIKRYLNDILPSTDEFHAEAASLTL